jgi:hypothetical protein
MSAKPSTQLVQEEPAWPDAVRVPLADAAGRERLLNALNVIDSKIAASAQNSPARRELRFAGELLREWTRLGIPQRPPKGYVGSLAVILAKNDLHDAVEVLRGRFGEEPLDPGTPLPPDPRVIVRIPPPPSLAGLAPYFLAPAPQLKLASVRRAQYAGWYRDAPDSGAPLRSRETPVTGLTAYLNGRLPTALVSLEPNLLRQVAFAWLFKSPDGRAPSPASCLLGLDLDLDAAARQFVYASTAIVPASRVVGQKGADDGLTAGVHVGFQQMYGAWPIFGSRLVVHMGQGDRRASVSSAYLPIPDGKFQEVAVRSEEDARAIALQALAQHALNGQVDARQARGFYLAALGHWLAAGGAGLPGQDWVKAARDVAVALADSLEGYADPEVVAAAASLVDLLAAWTPGNRQETLAALDRLGARLGAQQAVLWDAGRVVAYTHAAADDKRFVLPFVGQYYLAYLVEFVSVAGADGWRVFVNADAGDQSCHVLGWPESLVSHDIAVYLTSAAANAGVLSQEATAAIDLSFLSLAWYADQGGGPLTLPEIEGNPQNRSADLIQDAANVAYNASAFYQFFRPLCLNQDIASMLEDSSRVPPYFTVKVGAAAGPHDALSTGFIASRVAPAITFQSGALLRVGDRDVHHPARDPELVFHEIAHGLMWLMNTEPFETPDGVAPFGRALVEGYANYLARACAVTREGDHPGVPWARASYADFGDRYDLAHASVRSPAGNRLPFPNLYPPAALSDPDAADPLVIDLLQKYDVGMIWARALWGIREQYAAEGRDVTEADRLALSSFFYMPGWIASFEMAAEGLIDQVSPAAGAGFSARFATRNIVAGRAVQALIAAGDLFAGTDRGIWQSSDGGETWAFTPEPFGPGNGIVGLSIDVANGTLYAAAERSIHQAQPGGGWMQLGIWPGEETPISLCAAGGTVYVGTARGVYFFRTGVPAAGWARWQPAIAFEDPILDLAVVRVADANRVYAATARAAQTRLAQDADPNPAGFVWGPAAGSESLRSQMGSTTAVCLHDGQAYLGTLAAGIWCQPNLASSTSWVQIATPAQLAQGCVLALRGRVVGGTRELFAATTAGLYKGREAGAGWIWTSISLDNGAVTDVVMEVLPVGSSDSVIVGTANLGLWLGRDVTGPAPTWKAFPDVGA